MAARCSNCEYNIRSDTRDDPNFVARTSSGYVRLHPNQYYAGYTFFVAARCVAELHDLGPDERRVHLDEMGEVAEAVWRAFAPRKLNYEALGNSVAHLHWHLVPRHRDDPRPNAPIWENLDYLRELWTGETASATIIDSGRQRLVTALRDTGLDLVTTFEDE